MIALPAELDGILLVRELLLDGERGVLVHVLGQVVEDRLALRCAEALVERAQQLRATHLVTAALTEDLAGEGVDRVHVDARPRLLRGLLELQARVDALHVDVDVVQERAAFLAELLERAGLGLVDDAVGLLRHGHGLQAGDERERVDPGGVERGHARRVAALCEQQTAILLEHPAGAPGHVVASLAGDVRHVERVADERQALARRRLDVGRRGRAGGAERLALEVLGQVGGRDLVEQRREAVVHEGLLVRPGGNRHGAVLARRDDVQGVGGVVLCGRRGSGNQERRHEGERGTTQHLLS